jgi:hypothetical protein
VWAGPEIPHEELRNRLDEQTWDVTGIGFGQRGAQIPEIITLFEGTF